MSPGKQKQMHRPSKPLTQGSLTRAIQALPRPWRDLALMAQGYLATGQIELAETVFVQVGQLADPAAPAWAGALLCALCRGHEERAAAYLELLEATDPAGHLAAGARRRLARAGPNP